MNITSNFRRKNKYHKPIIVFKQLYRDYYQHNSPNRSCQSYQIYHSHPHSISKINSNINQSHNQNLSIPSIKKSNSTQQFTKYLQKHGDPGISLLKFTFQQSSNLQQSQTKQNNSYILKILQKNQDQRIKKDKRGYFKNSYTKSHPLFQKRPQFFIEKSFEDKQNQIPKILPQIFKQSGPSIKKPLQKRIELQQLKTKFIDRKQLATQKFSKIRHNFLMKHNYKPQSQSNQQIRSKNQNIMNSFHNTKIHIFPQQSY